MRRGNIPEHDFEAQPIPPGIDDLFVADPPPSQPESERVEIQDELEWMYNAIKHHCPTAYHGRASKLQESVTALLKKVEKEKEHSGGLEGRQIEMADEIITLQARVKELESAMMVKLKTEREYSESLRARVESLEGVREAANNLLHIGIRLEYLRPLENELTRHAREHPEG